MHLMIYTNVVVMILLHVLQTRAISSERKVPYCVSAGCSQLQVLTEFSYDVAHGIDTSNCNCYSMYIKATQAFHSTM